MISQLFTSQTCYDGEKREPLLLCSTVARKMSHRALLPIRSYENTQNRYEIWRSTEMKLYYLKRCVMFASQQVGMIACTSIKAHNATGDDVNNSTLAWNPYRRPASKRVFYTHQRSSARPSAEGLVERWAAQLQLFQVTVRNPDISRQRQTFIQVLTHHTHTHMQTSHSHETELEWSKTKIKLIIDAWWTIPICGVLLLWGSARVLNLLACLCKARLNPKH